MIRKNKGMVEWLEFDLLADAPGLIHGVFLRHGGVSQGLYDSLNVGGGSADDPNQIAENRRRLFEVFNISHCIEGKQVHGNEVIFIENLYQKTQECDALITDQKNIGMMIKHADCQAGIFYDPIHRVVANVHAGWRGQVKNIYGETIQKMRQRFGSKPQELLVGISPSLGPAHSEFIHYKSEFPEALWKFKVRSHYFDLWAMARFQLESAGVLPHHIEIAHICTYATKADFFSYRREKISGRHGTIVMLA